MNANAFRHFYNYHFAENRKVWEHVASLSFEQFTQKVDYSRGSVREQLVHLLDAERILLGEGGLGVIQAGLERVGHQQERVHELIGQKDISSYPWRVGAEKIEPA